MEKTWRGWKYRGVKWLFVVFVFNYNIFCISLGKLNLEHRKGEGWIERDWEMSEIGGHDVKFLKNQKYV